MGEGRLAGGEIDLRRVELGAVEIPANGRPGRSVAHDDRLRVGLLALVDRARRVQPVDPRLGADGHFERDGVDPNAFRVQQPRLRDRVAEVGAPVADDDDVAPRVCGQDRARELQRGGQVGVVGVGPALKVSELRVGADVDLDLRIAAEADDACPVVAVSRGEDPLHDRGFLVLGALRAGREVGQDHERLLRR